MMASNTSNDQSIVDPSIFHAYDVRGVYGKELDESIIYKIAQAYVILFHPKQVAVGRDVRESGPSLCEAAKNGFIDAGVDVIDIGMISTDMLYFAVAQYGYDGGITISASHNPKEFNGVKMVKSGAQPISSDNGILEIRDLVLKGESVVAKEKGHVVTKDILDDYCDKILSFLSKPLSKEYKIVANASCGMAGVALQKLIERGNLPLHVTAINFTPDGTFSTGDPNPLSEMSNKQTKDAISKTGEIDFAVAWDADADRCFFFDEKGNFILGNYTVAVLADYFLEHFQKSPVITTESVHLAAKNVTDKYGVELVLHKTGHSFIKATMRNKDITFAGETSGHYYFKDFFFADNGLIPFIMMLNILEEKKAPISHVYTPYTDNFFVSGEINIRVSNSQKVLQLIKDRYGSQGQIVEIDGVSVNFPDWRFNIRASNTEPLIRLNIETTDRELLERKKEEILSFLEGNKDSA